MATEAKPSSFLAGVKDEITEQFAGSFDELSEVTNDEGKLGESLEGLKKGIWTIVEKRLKESFLNGKKATANGRQRATATAEVAADKPRNPFRK